MDTNNGKTIVRRYLEEVVSGGNVGIGVEVIAEDVVFVSPGAGAGP